MAGLTSTGFQRLTLSEIKTEVENSLKSKLGKGINLIPPSVLATLVGIQAERESLLWQLAEDVYNSQYPDTAFGTSLDNVASLLGITRLDATKTLIPTQLLFGTVGTVIPAGTIVSLQGNSNAKFLTDTSVTLIAGVDEVQTLTFSAVPNSGSFKLKYLDQETSTLSFAATAANVQSALNGIADLSGVTVSGNFTLGFTITFAGDDGKQNQPLLLVTSNTLLNGVTSVTTSIVQTTAGVAQGQTTMTAQTAGATSAPRGSCTVIETLIAGFSRTINTEDGDIGRNIETDNELRVRRANSLQVAGAATVDAIRSRLAAIDGVVAALVFENTALVPDVDGRPPKSFEAVVQGGLDQEITQTVWDTKPAGIQTYGNTSGVAQDDLLNNHTVFWSRPTEIGIYIDIIVTTDFDYPVDGDTQVENALINFINTLTIGQDVIVYPHLICSLDAIPGITDITLGIGIAPSPVLDDNIIIAPDEIARTDSTKIGVTSI